MKTMKPLEIIAISILALAFASCKTSNSTTAQNTSTNLAPGSFEGSWIFLSSDSQDDVFLLSRIDSLKNDRGGIRFAADGTLIKRQNAGWCGTPPISYANFDGKWKPLSDSSLALSYSYWGGTIQEEWKVIRLDENHIELKSLELRTIKRR